MISYLSSLERKWIYRRRPASPVAAQDGTPVTVITGGTKGIGRALAAEFAAHGHHLLLIARTESDLAATAAMLRERHPGLTVQILAADLRDPDIAQRIGEALASHKLRAEFLVNNAGIGLAGAFRDETADNIRALIELNVKSLSVLMAHFLPPMLESGGGGIMNVASLAGFVPGPYQASYYASKAYVVSLTEAVAYENAGSGVRIAVLAPGPVETGFHQKMDAETANYLKMPGKLPAERVARTAYHNFMRWQTIIVPGILPSLAATSARIVPFYISTAFMSWLLKPRQPEKPQ